MKHIHSLLTLEPSLKIPHHIFAEYPTYTTWNISGAKHLNKDSTAQMSFLFFLWDICDIILT